MANIVEQYLKNHGPSLSSEITEFLVQSCKVSPAAARQRVSRGGKSVLRLDLSFPRRAKFLFLKEQAGTMKYWGRLEEALLSSNSAYGYAITALNARDGIMPRHHFEIACGSPIRQKKHLSVSIVLQKLLSTNLLKEIDVDGIGPCVYLGLHTNHIGTLIPAMKARIFAEELILRGVQSWLRKLGFVSYNQLKARTAENNPVVSTTAWDLAGPSYLSPLVSFKNGSDTPNPGFIVCDILLSNEVTESDILPFIQKLNALRNLKKVGKQLCFFVANSYDEKAFNKLKSLGVSPATTSAIFDNEIGKGMKELISLLSQVVAPPITSDRIDTIFSSLGKIEGASNRLRGALFEFVIAETMRSSYGPHVNLNRICQASNGTKEADVISVSHQGVRFIEGKGYNMAKQVTLDDINYWLNQQVPVFRAFALAHPDWKDKEMTFEFWTTGKFSPEASERLEKARQNTKKYVIDYKDWQGVTDEIRNSNNKPLLKMFSEHFIKNPLAHRMNNHSPI